MVYRLEWYQKQNNPSIPTHMSEMTLNYWMIVEMYPFPDEVVCGSIPTVKFSLYLIGKKLVK
jgi:hypothetical protein